MHGPYLAAWTVLSHWRNRPGGSDRADQPVGRSLMRPSRLAALAAAVLIVLVAAPAASPNAGGLALAASTDPQYSVVDIGAASGIDQSHGRASSVRTSTTRALWSAIWGIPAAG
jgi:hypothetical protein